MPDSGPEPHPVWVVLPDTVTTEEARASDDELAIGETFNILCIDPRDGSAVRETLINIEKDNPLFDDLRGEGVPLSTIDLGFLRWLENNPPPYQYESSITNIDIVGALRFIENDDVLSIGLLEDGPSCESTPPRDFPAWSFLNLRDVAIPVLAIERTDETVFCVTLVQFDDPLLDTGVAEALLVQAPVTWIEKAEPGSFS